MTDRHPNTRFTRPMSPTERSRYRRYGIGPEEYDRWHNRKQDDFRAALESGNHFLAIDLYNKAVTAAGIKRLP